MLRVVRFAAKRSSVSISLPSAPIAVMAPLINNVPAARLFDEMLKLLTSGHAMACLQQLRSGFASRHPAFAGRGDGAAYGRKIRESGAQQYR
jgi:phosphatidate phosphatase PAH1